MSGPQGVYVYVDFAACRVEVHVVFREIADALMVCFNQRAKEALVCHGIREGISGGCLNVRTHTCRARETHSESRRVKYITKRK